MAAHYTVYYTVHSEMNTIHSLVRWAEEKYFLSFRDEREDKGQLLIEPGIRKR